MVDLALAVSIILNGNYAKRAFIKSRQSPQI